MGPEQIEFEMSSVKRTYEVLIAGGAALVVDLENSPCKYPGAIIERHHPGRGHLFA